MGQDFPARLRWQCEGEMSILREVEKLAALHKKAGNVRNRLPKTQAELWAFIGFQPRAIQETSLMQKKRFAVEVWHRRAGKTVMNIVRLIERAVFSKLKDARFAFMAPTFAQAEDIAWSYLLRFTEPFEPLGRDVEVTKLSVTLPNIGGSTSRIRLYGVDNPKQRLRGIYLDGVVLDEFQQIPGTVWTEQVRPMLADLSRRGEDHLGFPNQWAVFVGTPMGRNQLYAMYSRAAKWHAGKAATEFDPASNRYVSVTSSDWYAALHRASETGLIPPDELAIARRDMGESKYMQEFECSFDAVVVGAVFGNQLAQLRRHGRIGQIACRPNDPVHTAWDLGWDDATAIWFWQFAPGTDHLASREIYLIDYLEVTHHSLADIAAKLAEKGYRYGMHILPWDVAVSELGTGKDRKSILRELGILPAVAPKPRIKQDAISAAQALLDRCWIDEDRCAHGLDMLGLYRREMDDRKGVYRAEPVHDFASHAADALMTLALGLKRVAPPPDQDERPDAAVF